MRNLTASFILTASLLCSGVANAELARCEMADGKAVVTIGEAMVEYVIIEQANGCVVLGGKLYLAAGETGVAVYSLDGTNAVPLGIWSPGNGEVIRIDRAGSGLVAVLGRLEIVPLQIAADGTVGRTGLASYMEGAVAIRTDTAGGASEAEAPVAPPSEELPEQIIGEVIEVRPEVAVLNVGSDDGVQEGDRYELRSLRLKSQYNLASGKEEMLPSNEVTAVVEVTSVTDKRALVKLGRGDRAEVGELAVPTNSRLTGDRWFPGYERNLNRVQARISPFLGIDSLSGGMLTTALYDRTFDSPMRLEAGFSNIGFIFGRDFAAPFHANVVPSYDTDYFEVGLGLGYVYSASEWRRGLSFLQKVRLGTVDGLSLTVRNSFVYQRARVDPRSWDNLTQKPAVKGDPCEVSDYYDGTLEDEFDWEGIDGTISIPLTSRVTLITDWSYSNAGWFYGDVGIRTLVMGNGGQGTLIIPVTVGGVYVRDFSAAGNETYCDEASNSWQTFKEYEETDYGGPVVSIGLDYRWR